MRVARLARLARPPGWIWPAAVGLSCAVWPLQAASKVPLVASYAAYRLAPGHDSCYVECSYGVSRDSLQFEYLQPDSIWQASFRVDLVLSDSTGRVVDSVSKSVGTRAQSWEETRKRDVKVIDVLSLYIPAGTYQARLHVMDLGIANEGVRLDTLVVGDKNRTQELTLSDLQFAYHIEPTDGPADPSRPKIKNGYYVEPNPSSIFAPEDSLLYLYGEIYNLQPTPAMYYVHLWILDPFGNVVKDLGPEELERPGETALLVYGLRIDDLPRGIWHTVAIEVEHGLRSASVRRPFWLGTGAQTGSDRATQPFDENDAALNRRFILYLATAEDLAEYDALTLEAKRRFLDNFWGRRDPDPSTTRNEFFEGHRLRFAIANQKFSRSISGQPDGWNTDRGRVLILYGEPDEVVLNASSIGTWGWERWEYRRLEGGVFFIFLDWKNLGDYRLMHSNKQGERYDPDWQDKIETEGIDIISR